MDPSSTQELMLGSALNDVTLTLERVLRCSPQYPIRPHTRPGKILGANWTFPPGDPGY